MSARASQRRLSVPDLEAILGIHHGKRVAELSAILLVAVHAFAQGAAQEDDITTVLVKREMRA